ncbi:adenylyl-sulfate kinase [Anoxybacillus sp. LAT_35]|uniref:Adenylyl-sulfate kinase n=1 Tax=Anoxybacillus kestanbolensis TaxID=227476 RepID=A0A1V3FH40_9BACL|nr:MULTISPECIES: adenylyl-sulfate kinase [Anoxybacillus]MCG5026278.1 adenylyl-sulfate kinase [Anoxybacillus flavithermus]MCG6196581.1 adenylyl-sulfate kinase [Anoxybacillus sp. LAT_38]QAV27771.1 adenylyl-sulfate kinase [Neobacillus thermocopriae]MCG3084277.1 adenylyl-sulfate kinase [Anoxybacillus sp. LAT27]MCG6172330.1 adenylyl-sulfate kinase [Anoxybacillus sp. LAT_11]
MNIIWHKESVTKEDRRKKNNHHSFVLWFTGLSGSGKSTLANAVAKTLFEQNIHCYVLDGDNVRHGLNSDLGFSAEDRTENIRRIGEVAKLFVDSGQIVLTAFISPFRQDRQLVRNKLAQDEFVEVYVRCPLETCEQRDPKGLYKKARNGEIRDFTGIDSPYEPPLSPDVVVDTDQHSIEQCVQQIISYLKNKQWI